MMYRNDLWSEARHDKEQRDRIIEECARTVEQYNPAIGGFEHIAAAIRALKEKS